MHVSPPSGAPRPGHQSAGPPPCASQWVPAGQLLHRRSGVTSVLLPRLALLSPPPPPLCPQVRSPCLRSCPAQMPTCIIFLDFIYVYVSYIQCLFCSFWLPSRCITDSSFIHITINDPILFLSFFLTNILLYIYAQHLFLIHSSADGHLGASVSWLLKTVLREEWRTRVSLNMVFSGMCPVGDCWVIR